MSVAQEVIAEARAARRDIAIRSKTTSAYDALGQCKTAIAEVKAGKFQLRTWITTDVVSGAAFEGTKLEGRGLHGRDVVMIDDTTMLVTEFHRKLSIAGRLNPWKVVRAEFSRFKDHDGVAAAEWCSRYFAMEVAEAAGIDEHEVDFDNLPGTVHEGSK